MQLSFFEKQTLYFGDFIYQIECEVMESLGVQLDTPEKMNLN